MSAFTVVIPLYNKEATIERAVASVLGQSVPVDEIIIVDDGSTDRGAGRVEAIAHPAIQLVRKPNGGVASARNAGIAAASHELVAFLDADDEWAPPHLEMLGSLARSFPSAVMLGGAYRKFDTLGRSVPLRLPTTHGKRAFLLDDYFQVAATYDQPICSSSVGVRRDALRTTGGFQLGVRAGEDLLAWARLACLGDVAISVEPTVTVYIPDMRPGNRASVYRTRSPESPDIVARELRALSRQYPAKAASITQYLGLWFRIRAMAYLELDERAACLRELHHAVQCTHLRARDVVMAGLLALPPTLRAETLLRIRLLLQPKPVA